MKLTSLQKTAPNVVCPDNSPTENFNEQHHNKFDEVKVSAYMSQSYIAVSMNDSVSAIKNNLANIITGDQIPTYLYVIDKNKYLNGLLLMKTLLTSSDELFVSDIICNVIFFSVSPDQSREEVFALLNHCDVDSIPVVEFSKLKGVLRAQDIAELIEDEIPKMHIYKAPRYL